MLEISPVLAGTFDAPDYAPAQVNVTSGNATPATTETTSASDSNPVDPRRYSKFDRTASQVGTTTMSFGDVLDMINPLQHIPVVSSVYRSVTGDTIHPVARVAGDILYGAPLGIVTALAGGMGAVADGVMESKTGKDVKSTLVAELFGSDTETSSNATTQVASAAPAPTLTASPATTTVSAQAVASAAPLSGTQPATQVAQGFAYNLNKKPYGGVMATMNSNMQQQNMAMALASATSTNGVRIGNTLYTNRFLNGPHPTAMAAATSSTPAAATTVADTVPSPASVAAALTQAAAPATTASSAPANAAQASVPVAALPATPVPQLAAATPAANIPSGLGDDPYILRALSMYQSVATGSRSGGVGANLN